jgi:hypothetical protein
MSPGCWLPTSSPGIRMFMHKDTFCILSITNGQVPNFRPSLKISVLFPLFRSWTLSTLVSAAPFGLSHQISWDPSKGTLPVFIHKMWLSPISMVSRPWHPDICYHEWISLLWVF